MDTCADGRGYEMCINGEEYGCCDHELCGGVCEPTGPCPCEGCGWEDCCALSRSNDAESA